MAIRLAAAAAAAVVASAVAGVPAHAAGAEKGPRLTLSAPSVSPGTSVIVTGDGFPANASTQVVLCGNVALAGSADCDMPHARVAGTDASGHFAAEVQVARPPSPCPCVVQASSLALPSAVSTAVVVTGAPVAAPRGAVPAAATTLKVKAALEGNGPAKAWFGAQPHRTLVLDVTNPGATARSPVLELQVGKGDKPTTAAPAPDLGTLAPGETRTYKIPVELDAFAVGGYSARGVLRGDGDPVAFKASTGTFPWGLLAGGLLVVQLVLLAVRDRARRRLVPAAEPAVADEPQHEPAVAAVAVRNPTATTVAVPRRAPRPPVIIVRRVVEPEPEPEFEPEPDAEPVGPFFEPVAVCTRRPAPQDAVREPDGARVPPPWAAWPKAAAPAALSELRELADAWGPTTVESAEVDLTVPVVPVVGSFLPVSQHALLRMGHESLQALESVDPLAYWASPLLTLRASKRAHLTPLREAS